MEVLCVQKNNWIHQDTSSLNTEGERINRLEDLKAIHLSKVKHREKNRQNEQIKKIRLQ